MFSFTVLRDRRRVYGQKSALVVMGVEETGGMEPKLWGEPSKQGVLWVHKQGGSIQS